MVVDDDDDDAESYTPRSQRAEQSIVINTVTKTSSTTSGHPSIQLARLVPREEALYLSRR